MTHSSSSAIPIQDVIDTQFERLPPHSIEAEMCCIASIMLDPEMANIIVPTMQGEVFYLTDHRIIFETIKGLHGARKPVDAIILRDELRRLGKLDDIGGTGYLGELLGKVPSAAHGEEYAARVRECAALRSIISSASHAIQVAYARGKPEAIASGLMQEMISISATGMADQIVSLGDALNELREDLMQGTSHRLKTGIVKLDQEMGGLPIGKLTIIGGRPGMGKSLVAKQIARAVARQGIPVGIVTVEENHRKIAENAAAAASGVDNRKISASNFGPGERERVIEHLDMFAGLPVYIIDSAYTLDEVEAAVATLKVKRGCQCVIVDHVHLIHTDDENNTAKVTKISGTLKRQAGQLDIALIAVAQLNRGNEQSRDRPDLHSLRESGSLEQDGDVVILLYREDYYHQDRAKEPNYIPSNDLELLIRKQKDGRTGTLVVKVDMRTQTIVGVDGGLEAQAAHEQSADERRVDEIFGDPQ